MTGKEYQELAMRTAPINLSHEEQLLNGCMGMCGESGEAIDQLKKFMFQGHELDKLHMAKEIGDVLWYAALATQALGFSLDDIMQMNIDKLRKRYPITFDVGLSINREEGDV